MICACAQSGAADEQEECHGIPANPRNRLGLPSPELLLGARYECSPSGISGEARRKLHRARIEAGVPVDDGLDAPVLDEAMRAAWGRIHPTNMGGEYLPPLREGEVEIARISLESTTADQISVRARRGASGFATASSTSTWRIQRTSATLQARIPRYVYET